MIMTAKTAEGVSIAQNKQKPPNSPVDMKIWYIGKVDGLVNVVDMLAVHTDVESIEDDLKMAKNARK